jgi:hypothetical protein
MIIGNQACQASGHPLFQAHADFIDIRRA